MKRVLAAIFAVAIVGLGVGVNAQTPNVTVYFDEYASETSADCPTEPVGTVYDEFLVVANNFNMWMNAIEYKIEFPPQIAWDGDVAVDNTLVLGFSWQGTAIVFTLPGQAFGPLVVQKVQFVWMCDNCSEANQNAPVKVVPYPDSGKIRALRYPDLFEVQAIGMTSLICATIPNEDTTWGKVKALYE
jgi:hypothetical protein